MGRWRPSIACITQYMKAVTTSFSSERCIIGFFNKPLIMTLAVSCRLASAKKTDGPPPPIKPNTRMKTNGKPMLNATDDGFRMIALKLPFVIASMARSWL